MLPTGIAREYEVKIDDTPRVAVAMEICAHPINVLCCLRVRRISEGLSGTKWVHSKASSGCLIDIDSAIEITIR